MAKGKFQRVVDGTIEAQEGEDFFVAIVDGVPKKIALNQSSLEEQVDYIKEQIAEKEEAIKNIKFRKDREAEREKIEEMSESLKVLEERIVNDAIGEIKAETWPSEEE
jgi:hypothetical protein